ncbi:efflux transporter outer membrane subunit [Flavisphingomonas formosensis]|uniref:efflux transporter outer membrane subunit n=1 Tax=Flavisphingomonas formosensis TaxID=861534 RepID=UPI0012FB45CD|nr:efflux transporter outer membrane subunit [Sphingomonas formosensis]
MTKKGSIALAFMLAACDMAPKHVRPALPTAPAYPADTAQPAGEIRAADIGWRDFFVDPQLKILIATALEHNRDLAVSVARIQEARGQYRIQEAERLPELDANGAYTRSRVGAASLSGQGAVPAGRSGVEYSNYSASVGVSSFELDFWGRVKNLSKAARESYFSTVQAERAFRLSLIRDVATTYLAAREADEQIALAERTVKSREDGLHIAKLRLDAGVTSALDYRQAETLLTQAQTSLASLRLSLAQNRNALEVLTGQPLAGDLPPPLPLEGQRLDRAIVPGLPSDLLDNRPDIISAEDSLKAARANVGAARAAFFPRITLTGDAGFSSTSLDKLVGKDGLGWSFGPSISLPIFDWGATKGNLDVAKARENIAVATYEKTVQTAFQEVADALAGRRWLADQVAAQQRAVVAQTQLADLARTRYANGVAEYLEVLDAERNLFSAQQALIQLHRAEEQNLVSLYVALGGGLKGAE